ncbi:hypothetical protein EDD18DRAFT_1348439 [Armillaria luteobubalina]|uniref:BTB domain-containing protein n=1 Tax=Armillaria luteobubalina TaxID=153913 RepID=A0AA39UWU9_9AGAR|nr:hypothetical protein EDD18DRAFT_1348439 [Armillaria luteobubalina]
MATVPTTRALTETPFNKLIDSVILVIRTAGPPFNDPTDCVDLVIRTADNVDFFVLSGLLSLRSPSSFFRHFLKNNQNAEERDGFPVLKVEEDSNTFHTILLLCYPNVAPQIKSVEQIVSVKKALDKYRMDHILELFVQMVIASPLMKEQALRIFAHAVFNGWRTWGEAAAKDALAIPLDDPGVELENMDYIDTLQYLSLRDYRRECRRVAQDMLLHPNTAPWLEGKASELLFLHDNTNRCRWCGSFLDFWLSSPPFRTHPWVTEYLIAVKTEMLRRPRPEIALDAIITADAVTKSVSQCPKEEWKKIAVSQIHLCGKLLMEELNRQILQVPLDIDWTK